MLTSGATRIGAFFLKGREVGRGHEFGKLNPIFHDKGAHAFEGLNCARISKFKRNSSS